MNIAPSPNSRSGGVGEQVMDEKKILRISMKQNLNRKIARLLSKSFPTT